MLPGYARVAVIAGQRNAQNRPTAANKSKLEIAKKNAIAVAMGLRR